MASPHAVDGVVVVSVPTPPSQSHLAAKREELILRELAPDHFRWFHADGTQTVVEGRSIDHALRVAGLVWSDVEVVRRAPN